MKFFVDTANIDEIREAAALGLLDGVTTNPSLIAKTGRKFREVVDEICAAVDGPVSLEVVARACQNILCGHAATRNLRLSVAIDPHLPAVRGDERAIKQVLLNLLSNAIKFTDPGGKVAITGMRVSDGTVVLRVADTGVGIPPEQITEIFKPFRHADSAVRRSGQGAGLGLSISRKLIELHGGRLDIKSALARGTTASISFPAERAIRAAS